jgi:hypothetical protein
MTLVDDPLIGGHEHCQLEAVEPGVAGREAP